MHTSPTLPTPTPPPKEENLCESEGFYWNIFQRTVVFFVCLFSNKYTFLSFFSKVISGQLLLLFPLIFTFTTEKKKTQNLSQRSISNSLPEKPTGCILS